jgi:AIPR protein
MAFKKSIHDAYDELNDKDKEHFATDCEVLVRLHTRQAVSDYKELVKSTNNQNPMQPRNLRSNDPEQVYFERLFADLNWFYERKEGAWKAFQSDSDLWGSLRGKKVSDFKISGRQCKKRRQFGDGASMAVIHWLFKRSDSQQT